MCEDKCFEVINVKEGGWSRKRSKKLFEVNNDSFPGTRNNGWRYRGMNDWSHGLQ